MQVSHVSILLLVAGGLLTGAHAADARDAKAKKEAEEAADVDNEMSHSSYATMSSVKAKEKAKTNKGKAATPDAPADEDIDPAFGPVPYEGDALNALGSTSSFPMRLVFGDATRTNESWDQLPAETVKPTGLTRQYAAGQCQFELQTGAFSVRTYERKQDSYVLEKDGHAPQSVLQRPLRKPLLLSVSTEMIARVLNGTEKSCAKIFGERRVRFLSVSIAESEIYAANLANKRLDARAVATGEPFEVYLHWDETATTLRASDRYGLPTSVATSIVTFDADRDGTYYLNFRPQWSLTLIQRTAERQP